MKRLSISLKMVFMLLLMLATTGCYYRLLHKSYDMPPGVPRLFNENYDKVWDAVVNTLNERGFVINQMRKEEGYIDTKNRKEGAYNRERISVRLVKMDSEVKVTVQDYEEYAGFSFINNKAVVSHWKEGEPSGLYQQRILDDIEKKLRRSK
ncbi:MAG: hypothetical protein HY893_03585 [Deltaproteobacteria bacterium]|nr:hypothetical protein [Deltaproteobacteria bacterium]